MRCGKISNGSIPGSQIFFQDPGLRSLGEVLSKKCSFLLLFVGQMLSCLLKKPSFPFQKALSLLVSNHTAKDVRKCLSYVRNHMKMIRTNTGSRKNKTDRVTKTPITPMTAKTPFIDNNTNVILLH